MAGSVGVWFQLWGILNYSMFKRNDLSGRKKKNNNGYLETFLPSHPSSRDGWVLLHRCVMENHLGRYLDETNVVHHLNEIKTCNEIWNLFLTDEKTHTLIHRLGATHTKKARGNMSKEHKKLSKKRKRDFSGKYIPEALENPPG